MASIHNKSVTLNMNRSRTKLFQRSLTWNYREPTFPQELALGDSGEEKRKIGREVGGHLERERCRCIVTVITANTDKLVISYYKSMYICTHTYKHIHSYSKYSKRIIMKGREYVDKPH